MEGVFGKLLAAIFSTDSGVCAYRLLPFVLGGVKKPFGDGLGLASDSHCAQRIFRRSESCEMQLSDVGGS